MTRRAAGVAYESTAKLSCRARRAFALPTHVGRGVHYNYLLHLGSPLVSLNYTALPNTSEALVPGLGLCLLAGLLQFGVGNFSVARQPSSAGPPTACLLQIFPQFHSPTAELAHPAAGHGPIAIHFTFF